MRHPADDLLSRSACSLGVVYFSAQSGAKLFHPPQCATLPSGGGQRSASAYLLVHGSPYLLLHTARHAGSKGRTTPCDTTTIDLKQPSHQGLRRRGPACTGRRREPNRARPRSRHLINSAAPLPQCARCGAAIPAGCSGVTSHEIASRDRRNHPRASARPDHHDALRALLAARLPPRCCPFLHTWTNPWRS